MNNGTVKYIVECVLENVQNVSTLPRNEFNDAKRLACYEILNTIKNQLEINDVDLKEVRLFY